MAITASVPQSANYAPKATLAEGLQQLVVFHVQDLGMVPLSAVVIAKNKAQRVKEGGDPNTVKSEVHKARVFFNNASGEFISKDYNLSLHEKADLAKDLRKMGKTFGRTYDVETLVGTQTQAMIEEATSGRGTVYVKIATLAKPSRGQNVKPLANRPPVADKNPTATAAPADPVAATEITDEDIPF